MSRATTAAMLGTLLALSGAAHGRKVDRALQDHYHVWAELSFEGLDWKTDSNYLLLAEGLRAGSNGYISDPHLLSYRLRGGLLDYHINQGAGWTNSFGWDASLTLNGFPASRFPVSCWVHHMTMGLSPGGHPALNLVDQTEVGGQIYLRLAGWPELQLEGRHVIQTVNQTLPGTVQLNLDPSGDGPATTAHTQLGVHLRKSGGGHRYQLDLDLRDRADEELQTRFRSANFIAGDRTSLTPSLVLGATVNGRLGEIGDLNLEQRSLYADYGARLDLLLQRRKKLQLAAHNTFQRATYGSAGVLSDELVGEMTYFLRPWLELFFGLAGTFLKEEDSASNRIAAREEAASGVRLARPVLGGTAKGQVLLRLGETQVIDEGHGVFFAVSSTLAWSRRLGQRFEAMIHGQSLNQWDASPIGADREAVIGRASVSMQRWRGISATLEGQVSHSAQEERFLDTFTDTYTDVGGRLLLHYHPWPWLGGRASTGYSSFLASAQGAAHRYYVDGQLYTQPLPLLRVEALALYSRHAGARLSDFTQLRVEGRFTWRIRQLLLRAKYSYVVDDYRGIGSAIGRRGGDHRVTFRIVRRFDVRFGRAE